MNRYLVALGVVLAISAVAGGTVAVIVAVTL